MTQNLDSIFVPLRVTYCLARLAEARQESGMAEPAGRRHLEVSA